MAQFVTFEYRMLDGRPGRTILEEKYLQGKPFPKHARNIEYFEADNIEDAREYVLSKRND